MNNLPDVLLEWIKENGWDDIVIDDDVTVEANANLRRLFLSTNEARAVSLLDICNLLDVYTDIKRDQVLGKNSRGMLLYIWHDEISGSLCLSCISKSHLPGLPFACRLNTNASVDEIVASFLNSRYLDGIPAGELEVVDPEQDCPLDLSPSEFVLPVHIVTLP